MATKTTPALDAGIVKRGAAAPAQAPEAENEPAQATDAAQPAQRGPSPVMTAMMRLMPTPPTEGAPPKTVVHRVNKRATPKDLGFHMQSVKLTADEYKRVRWAGFVLGKSYQEIYTEALTDWLIKHKDVFDAGFAKQE